MVGRRVYEVYVIKSTAGKRGVTARENSHDNNNNDNKGHLRMTMMGFCQSNRVKSEGEKNRYD